VYERWRIGVRQIYIRATGWYQPTVEMTCRLS